MSELRQRQIPKPEPEDEHEVEELDTEEDEEDVEEEEDDESSTGISLVDILRVLVTLVVASCGLSYYVTSSESLLWGYRPWFTRWPVLMRYIVCCCFALLCPIHISYHLVD